jgi:hypothetical protein
MGLPSVLMVSEFSLPHVGCLEQEFALDPLRS